MVLVDIKASPSQVSRLTKKEAYPMYKTYQYFHGIFSKDTTSQDVLLEEFSSYS